MRRRRGDYFARVPGVPAPVSFTVRHRVSFSEVDAMAVAWHGRYLQFFELAAEALSRRIGLSYSEYFAAGLRAPIVQCHVDYHCPAELEEELSITASLLWTEAARLNLEYAVVKGDGRLAATGYSVQMFTDAVSGEPYLVQPELFRRCLARCLRGELEGLA